MWRRFWAGALASTGSLLLLLVTLRWPDWLEVWFGVNPDYGSGRVEGLLVAVSSVAAVVALGFTRIEWRRAHRARTAGVSP